MADIHPHEAIPLQICRNSFTVNPSKPAANLPPRCTLGTFSHFQGKNKFSPMRSAVRVNCKNFTPLHLTIELKYHFIVGRINQSNALSDSELFPDKLKFSLTCWNTQQFVVAAVHLTSCRNPVFQQMSPSLASSGLQSWRWLH